MVSWQNGLAPIFLWLSVTRWRWERRTLWRRPTTSRRRWPTEGFKWVSAKTFQLKIIKEKIIFVCLKQIIVQPMNHGQLLIKLLLSKVAFDQKNFKSVYLFHRMTFRQMFFDQKLLTRLFLIKILCHDDSISLLIKWLLIKSLLIKWLLNQRFFCWRI
jgi:hypothetical protein